MEENPALDTPPIRKGGRPRLDPEAVRTSTIGVRVSESEYAAIRDRAASMGMTPAQFLRETALSRRLPSPPAPAANRELYADLGHLASNINQLAREAHSGGLVVVPDDLLAVLVKEVRLLRLALIGEKVEA